MSLKKVVLIIAALTCFVNLGCSHRIKSTSFILRGNTASLPGISQGGTLKWVSDEATAFTVHIKPSSPCKDKANDLPSQAKREHGWKIYEASCKIDQNVKGVYIYSILPGASPTKLAGVSLSGGEFAFHTDYCPCPPPPGTASVGTFGNPTASGSTTGAGPDIVVGCNDQGTSYSLTPNPSVSPTGAVLWTAAGKYPDARWQATFNTQVCSEGLSVGTIVPNSKTQCTVQASAGEVTYTLQYQSGVAGQTCHDNSNAKLTILPSQ